MTPASDARRAAFRAAAAIALAALAAAAAGLPLAAPGLAEEWSIRWALDRGQPWVLPDVLAAMPTRPLTAVSHAVARVLTPDSFAGEKVLLLALRAGIALAGAALLARLVPGAAAAAAGTSLAVLVPADSALFNTRDLPNHTAMCLTLLALVLYARAAERPSAGRAAAMAICAAAALATYESPLLFLLFAPALLPLAAPPARRGLLALWTAVPVAFAAAALASTRGGYVASLFSAGGESPGVRAAATAAATLRMTWRALAAPLLEGSAALATGRPVDAGLAALAGALAALVVAGDRRDGQTPRAGLGSVFLAGLALLALGVLPYALAPALRAESRRVFLLGSIGAGIAIAAAVAALPRRGLRIAACGALVALSVAAGRARNAETSANGRRVAALVRSLAEGAPSPPPGTALLLLDADGPPGSEDVLGLTITDVHLADALRVVHGQADLFVYVYGRDLRYRWNGTPEAHADGVTVRRGGGSTSLVPWEKVAVFHEEASGRVTRLDELPRDLFPFPPPGDLGRLVPRAGPPPPRLETLCPPLIAMHIM